MSKYHINPETGNPNVCKAKVSCPFGDKAITHYSTKEEAHAAYEEYMSNPMSTGSRYVIEAYKLQQEISNKYQQAINGNVPVRERMDNLKPLIEKRDAYYKALEEEYEGSRIHSLKPASVKSTKMVPLGTPGFTDDKAVVGFANVLYEAQQGNPELMKQMDQASMEWIKTLNDKEVDAVRSYSFESATYATSVNNDGNADDKVENFHNALHKAPAIPETKVYSGLSRHARDLVLDALSSKGDNGVFNANRALSTSVNPAQVNGFMTNNFDSENPDENVALEIETDKGAVMNAVSGSPDEFEILIPPGNYEYISERKNVEFLWEEDGHGRTADRVLRLRYLG